MPDGDMAGSDSIDTTDTLTQLKMAEEEAEHAQKTSALDEHPRSQASAGPSSTTSIPPAFDDGDDSSSENIFEDDDGLDIDLEAAKHFSKHLHDAFRPRSRSSGRPSPTFEPIGITDTPPSPPRKFGFRGRSRSIDVIHRPRAIKAAFRRNASTPRGLIMPMPPETSFNGAASPLPEARWHEAPSSPCGLSLSPPRNRRSLSPHGTNGYFSGW